MIHVKDLKKRYTQQNANMRRSHRSLVNVSGR
jgi:hypothetical protein